jgi:uncharacterized protein (DUF2147 family)
MKLCPTRSAVAFLAAALSFLGASIQAAVPMHSTAAQEAGGNAGQGPTPLFGKITAVHDTSIEILNANGENVTVKVTGKTQFRKDRQEAKRSDFKVGDLIIVRGQENSDRSWAAEVIAGRSGGGREGREGRGGGFGGQGGTLGKDFVAGEITAIDAPKLSVLRSDKVTQSFELNEETSLRKGRDSITMADVQVGDHVFARGGLENNMFVPKVVMVISPEQWKRMQDWTNQAEGQRRPPSPSPNAGAGAGTGADSQTPKPPEPQP